MLIRSNSSPIASPVEPARLTLPHLLISEVGGVFLFLLLAAGFIVTAKVLVSPFLTPVPASHPELAPQPISQDAEALVQSSINCLPTALTACLTE